MELNVNAPNQIGPYQIRGTIGQGAFSVVRLAFNPENKFYSACKIVPKSRLSSPELEERFEAEIRIFQGLSHPNIVSLYDLLKDDLNYYVFMEFCPNGELFQHIVDNGKLSEQEGQTIVLQLFSALDYLHKQGIAHRDLKPENLLLSESGSLKISDFGLSKYVGERGIANTPCGSPCYASPECVSGKPYNAIASDIWSSGVILYAALTGQLPWTKRNQAQLFQQIRRGEYSVPRFLSFECQDFIRGLMTVDITKRLTIEQALQHPWMQNAKSPIENNIFEPVQHVSLKKVDNFFSSDIFDLNIKDNELRKCLSTNYFAFSNVIRYISNNDGLDLKPITNAPQKKHPMSHERVIQHPQTLANIKNIKQKRMSHIGVKRKSLVKPLTTKHSQQLPKLKR